MKCTLPHVDAYRDRHGKQRYYFRRNRRSKRVKLPGEPGSAEFIRAYNDAIAAQEMQTPAVVKAKPGSLDALRELYVASSEFENLAKTTQREIRYVLDALCATSNAQAPGKRGDNPVEKLEPRHILAWRDKLRGKPGAANKMLRIVKAWLSFAVQRQFRKDNPAFGIKPLKIGRIRAWTDDELMAFEAKWPYGSLERTGYALALYTAQRRADVAAMKWSAIAGKTIYVRQSKTKTDLAIHMHPTLVEALAAVQPRRADTILAGERGKSLNPIYFGHLMADAIEAAGLPKDCVLHGLRKTAARIVAETGGPGSVTHRTPHCTDGARVRAGCPAEGNVQSGSAKMGQESPWEQIVIFPNLLCSAP